MKFKWFKKSLCSRHSNRYLVVTLVTSLTFRWVTPTGYWHPDFNVPVSKQMKMHSFTGIQSSSPIPLQHMQSTLHSREGPFHNTRQANILAGRCIVWLGSAWICYTEGVRMILFLLCHHLSVRFSHSRCSKPRVKTSSLPFDIFKCVATSPVERCHQGWCHSQPPNPHPMKSLLRSICMAMTALT